MKAATKQLKVPPGALKELGGGALGDRKLLLAAIARMQTSPREGVHAEPEGERRQVTVLFADITDFTGISERLGAESSHEALNRHFETVDRTWLNWVA